MRPRYIITDQPDYTLFNGIVGTMPDNIENYPAQAPMVRQIWTAAFIDEAAGIRVDSAGNLLFHDESVAEISLADILASDSQWRISGNHMYSSNSGSIGIGTIPTDAFKLDVNGGIRAIGKLTLDVSGSDTIDIAANTLLGYDFRIHNVSDDVTRLTINTQGRLSINTTAAQAQVNVVATEQIYAGSFSNTNPLGYGMRIVGGSPTTSALDVVDYLSTKILSAKTGLVSITGNETVSGNVQVDSVLEFTTGNGVLVDSILIKDSTIAPSAVSDLTLVAGAGKDIHINGANIYINSLHDVVDKTYLVYYDTETGKLSYGVKDDSIDYPPAGIVVSTGAAWGESIVDNSTNWNTAYSWGNHAEAGYLTSSSIQLVDTAIIFSDNTTGNASTSMHGYLPKLSGSDYQHLNGHGLWEQVDSGHSGGILSEPAVTDHGDGSITVASAEINAYHTSGYVGIMYRHFVPSATFNLVDNAMNYIMVSYADGFASYISTIDVSAVDWSMSTPVYSIFRHGTALHLLSWDSSGLGLAEKLLVRETAVRRFERESGLLLGVTTGRVVTISSGYAWNGIRRHVYPALTSTTDCVLYYHSAGAWTRMESPTYNNTQYDNGTNLVLSTGNKYLVNWIYRGMDETGKMVITLGTVDYPSFGAADAAVPRTDLLPIFGSVLMLVGRIIVQNGAVVASQIDSAFSTVFSMAAVSDHGNLSGLLDDDHIQYALLAGRPSGQTLYGGTAAGGDLTLHSTSSITKGNIFFGDSTYDEVNNRLGLGTLTPQQRFSVVGNIGLSGQIVSSLVTGTAPLAVTSITLNTNLNADLLDGLHSTSYFKDQDVIMNTNPFGGRALYINSIDNAMYAADRKWYVTVTTHLRSYNGENYPKLNPDWIAEYTVAGTGDTYSVTGSPIDIVVYVDTVLYTKVDIPTTGNNYSYIDGTITFGKTITGVVRAYPSYTLPQYLDSPIVNTSNAYSLFDGNYEGGMTVSTGYYMKVHIQFNSDASGNMPSGFPYGTYFLSYYYSNTPEKSEVRTYNRNYWGHGIGWKLANMVDFLNTSASTNYIQSYSDQSNFGRTIIEFIIYAHPTHNTQVSEIDWKLSRPNLTASGSTVTKYGINKLYYNLQFGNQTTSYVDINPTGLITATRFSSTIATGTAPLSVTSTTLNTNLNADLLDGQHSSYFQPIATAYNTGNANLTTVDWSAKNLILAGSITGATTGAFAGDVTIGGNLHVTGNITADGEIAAFIEGIIGETMWDSMPLATATSRGGIKLNTAQFVFNASDQLTILDSVIAPKVHTHAIADVTDLQVTLDNIDTERLAAVSQLTSSYQTADTDLNNTLTTALTTKLDSSSYTAADILAKLLTVDGIGSGLDAELLGGQQSGYYSSKTYVDDLGATKVSKTGDTMTGKLILSGHGSQKLMMSYSSIGFAPVADSITGNLVLGQWEDYFLDLTNAATGTAGDATVFRINANTTTGKEATLALVRGEYPNIECLDLYNNGYDDSLNYGIRIQKRGTGEYRDFKIDQSDGTTRTPLMMIKVNGNVGIGTTDPTSKLTVAGDTTITGNLHVSGNITAEGEIAAFIEGIIAGTIWDNMPYATATSIGGIRLNPTQFNFNVDNQLTILDSVIAPKEHTHDWADITSGVPNYTLVGHTHVVADVTDLQTALNAKLNTSLKGAVNGLAELDGSGKVLSSQLPSYVDDVLEYATLSGFPATGESGKIYIAVDTNLSYRWTGSGYAEISPSIALGETSSTAYRGDRGKIAYDHSQSAHAYLPLVGGTLSGALNLINSNTSIESDGISLYLKAAGTVYLNTICNVYANNSGQLVSSLATGTSPFNVTSTTVNTNLNADLLDGYHQSNFAGYVSGVTDIHAVGGQNLYTFFASGNFPSNAPEEGADWVSGIQMPIANNPNYRSILATIGNDFYRTKEDNGTWRSWYKLYDSGNSNLSTVDWAAKNVTIAGTLQVISTATFSSAITMPSHSTITGPINSYALLNYKTGSSLRWAAGKTNNVESGSNVGSDYYIYRYSDTGDYLGFPFSINRATGLVSCYNGLSVAGDTVITARLGVGTTPVYPFHIKTGTDQNFQFRPNGYGSGSGILLQAANDADNLGVPFEFGASQFSFMAGNVGIHTVTPGALLDISGSTLSNVQAIFCRGGNDAGFILIASNGSGDTISSEQAWFGLSYFTSRKAGISFYRGDSANGNMIFQTSAGDGIIQDRAIITTDGNVGIGTITPTSKLTVVGDTTITGNLHVSGDITADGEVAAFIEGILGSGNFLPITGGEMTGNLILSPTITIIQNQQATSNYTASLAWYKGGVPQATYNPQIGQHNTGNTTGSITILPYPTEIEPWSGTVGLFITESTIKFKNQSIWHSGNSNLSTADWAAKDVTASGILTVTGHATTSNLTISGDAYSMLHLNRTSANGSSILFHNTAGDIGKLGFDSSGSLIVGTGGSAEGVADLLKITTAKATTLYGSLAINGAITGATTGAFSSTLYTAGNLYVTTSVYPQIQLKAGSSTTSYWMVYNTASVVNTCGDLAIRYTDGTYYKNYTIAKPTLTASANGKILTDDNLNGLYTPFQTLTYGSTTTWNMANGYNATVTLTGNTTLSITNAVNGISGVLIVKQNISGGNTLTLPSGSKILGGGTLTLSTTASAIDMLTFTYDGTNYYWSLGKNYA